MRDLENASAGFVNTYCVGQFLFAALLFTVLTGCGDAEPVAPIATYNSDSGILDVMFLPGQQQYIVLSEERVIAFETGQTSLLMESAVLPGADDNYGRCVTYSNRDRSLVVSHSDKGFSFLDPESLTLNEEIDDMGGAQFYYEIPDEPSYITVVEGNNLARIHGETSAVEWEVNTLLESIYCPHAFSKNWVAISDLNDRVKVYSIATGEPAAVIIGHQRSVRGIAFSSDESFVASTGDDGYLRVFSMNNGEPLWEIENDGDGAFGIAIHPNNDFIAVGCMSGIKIWSIKSKKLISSWKAHTWFTRCLAFSADGDFLLSGSADRSAKLWRTEDFVGRLQ